MLKILDTVIGSRAYNLDREASDWDRRSIYVVPTADLFKLQTPPDTAESGEAMEVGRWAQLAAGGSPNPLEYLFSKYAEPLTEDGQLLLDNREVFLSKKMVPRFIGFARGNLKRYKDNPKTILQAFRLLLTCKSLLETGVYRIEMPDSAQSTVEKIRHGELSVYSFMDDMVDKINELEKTTSLRDEPDYEFINGLLYQIRMRHL